MCLGLWRVAAVGGFPTLQNPKTNTLTPPHPQVLIPVTFNLLATSVAIIYIGCHRSLVLRDKGAVSDEEPLETISKEARPT